MGSIGVFSFARHMQTKENTLHRGKPIVPVPITTALPPLVTLTVTIYLPASL